MILFALIGTGLVGYMPRMVSGALLITIGVGLLVEWVGELRQSISRVEQVLSIGILAVIAFVGILEGIAVGIVAVSAVFVIRYSRIDPVRTTGSGKSMRSRIDRPPGETVRLAEVADRAAFYQLHGYLFFGSLALLEDRLRNQLNDDTNESDAILLDTARVTGIDTSGYRLFGQLATIIAEAGSAFVITGMEEHLQKSLRESEPAMKDVIWRNRLDQGFEFIERLQLDRWGTPDDVQELGIQLSPELQALFEEVELPANTLLMSEGEASSEFFVVESGTLTASTVDESGSRRRLRQFGAGAVVGEIAMLTGGTRSADVTTETSVELLKMTRADYDRARSENPQLAMELLEVITIGQANRVRSLSDSLARALD